jgi:hypothetical protein
MKFFSYFLDSISDLDNIGNRILKKICIMIFVYIDAVKATLNLEDVNEVISKIFTFIFGFG